MNKSLHSPAPWQAVIGKPSRRDTTGTALVSTGRGTMAADFLHSGDSHEESAANAKLAAASPRLLRAAILVSADDGPLWDWCNQQGIGKEEWTRRRDVADLVLSAIEQATK